MSGFDLVLVNILTPVVRSFLEAGLSQVLKPGAILITSGIKLNEVSIIERSASKAGLTDPIVKNMEGWAVVVSRKASPPNQRK
jgi:ribosomal protein L11 methylase PrmA